MKRRFNRPKEHTGPEGDCTRQCMWGYQMPGQDILDEQLVRIKITTKTLLPLFINLDRRCMAMKTSKTGQ